MPTTAATTKTHDKILLAFTPVKGENTAVQNVGGKNIKIIAFQNEISEDKFIALHMYICMYACVYVSISIRLPSFSMDIIYEQ